MSTPPGEIELSALDILDGVPDGIALLSLDGSVIYSNRTLQHMYGVSGEHVRHLSVGDLAGSDHRIRWLQFFKQATTARGEVSFDTAIQRLAGESWFYAELSFYAKTLNDVPVVVMTVKDMSRHKLTEDALRLEEARLEALLRLNQMTGEPLSQICAFALDEAIRLTGSVMGYIAFYSEEQKKLTMHAWSLKGREKCHIVDRIIDYPLNTTGLWGEAVRQRKPVITNDYLPGGPHSKGLPEGHVSINRHLNIPIFDNGQIVVVAGVGNKPDPYDLRDIRELVLLMEGMWRLLQRKQAEDQLKLSLAEKEVLLKEIHHRVKNNLQIVSSLISLQSGVTTQENVRAAFQESQDRIRVMAMIHERLYQSGDIARVDFGEYLGNLTAYLKASYRPRSVDVQIDVRDILLGIDRAIPCGLIINELVSNAFKYAFLEDRHGTLRISMRKEGEAILLTVEDDGPGMPFGFDVRNTPTLGLQLVNALVGQLDGELAMFGTKGTKFEIRFR